MLAEQRRYSPQQGVTADRNNRLTHDIANWLGKLLLVAVIDGQCISLGPNSDWTPTIHDQDRAALPLLHARCDLIEWSIGSTIKNIGLNSLSYRQVIGNRERLL